MASIIQIRRDTASDWTSANPTLAQGELALETDTLKLKAGDGTTAWTSLAYYTLGTAGFLATTGGALTGALTTNSTIDGRDVAADGVLATNALPKSGGTLTGAIDMGSNNVTTTGKILYSNMYSALSDLPSASTYHGMFAHVHATGKGYFAHGGAWIELANQTDLSTATTTAGAALAKAGGAMTGAITTNSTFDGRDVATDGTKLDNVATPVITGTNTTATNASNHVVSAGGITITLPASPSAGNYVIIKDGTGAAATTTFTVARNGSNIASSASDLTFDKNFAEVVMTYVNSTIGWSV